MRNAPGLRVFLSIVCLLFASAAAGDERTFQLTFASEHQSMWGPGRAAPPLNTRFTILNPNTVKFDVETAGYPGLIGPFETVDTFFWGEVNFGIGARAKAAAHFGLFADLAVPNPGSVDVTYPVTPVVVFPDANSFHAGDTVTVNTTYTVDPGWKLQTQSPVVEFELKGDFGLNLDLYGKACIVACLDSTSLGLRTPIVNSSTGEFTIFKIGSGNTYSTPPQLGLVSPISGSIKVPNIQTTGTLVAKSLTATGEDEFITVALDLGSIAEALFKLPPLSFDTQDFGDFDAVGGVRLHYTILGADAVAALDAVQNFRFDPDLRVGFTFPEPLQYWVTSNGTAGAVKTGAAAEIKVGDSLHVITPPQKDPPVPLVPTFRLDNTFSSQTRIDLEERVEVEAGDLGIKIPEFTIIPRLCTPGFCIDWGILGETCVPEICTPKVTYDPPDFDIAGDSALYEQTFPLGRQQLGNIVNSSWQMTGFPQFTVDAFTLDPENPIVKVFQRTAASRNLGSGRRLVAFVIDISNPGDVPLSEVKLEVAFAEAFADAREWKVDRLVACDLTPNADFDGGASNDTLAAGNTLPVAVTKRMTVYAIVSPKPDPPTYAVASHAEGRSVLGTLVDSDANSSVLLGPGTPKSASDYVVFGDKFVKLTAIADSFGHIGSNDFIEVKNGASGVVAGDLRAARSMKVAGSISADYAISRGIIDIVGKGFLTLFGNAKPFYDVPPVTVTSPQWAPTTEFAGDVWVAEGATAVLSPGNYGYVTVNDGADLQLEPGTYYVNHLVVLSNAAVRMMSPVNVIVGRTMEVGTFSAIVGDGSSRQSVIHAVLSGAIEVRERAMIRGTLIAPRANVMFGAKSRLEGSVCGSSVTLSSGSSVVYHRDCDPVIDANCDGMPECPAR